MHERFAAEVRKTIEHVMARVAYFGVHTARVVKQHSDGTVDLKVDSTYVPHVERARIRGLPGVAVEVHQGAPCLLAFESADPARAVATLFDASSLKTITITASVKVVVDAPAVELADALGAVVREGDTITVGSTGGVVAISPTAVPKSKVKA